MTKRFFITATDTDAGKTHIASALCYGLSQHQLKVAAFKPIAAGCEPIEGKLQNADVLALKTWSNCKQTEKQINHTCFEQAIAPHIAAKLNDKSINLIELENHYYALLNNIKPDVLITEGAGGWRLPLGNGQFLSELAVKTQQQVILVVNMKLGCLNHALLSYEAIVQDGLMCSGFICNSMTDMPYLKENIAELKALLPVPCLGEVGFEPDIKKLAAGLNFDLILF